MVERAHRGEEPGAFRTDHPVGRNPDVVEVDLPRRRPLDAELLLGRTEGHTRVVLLHDERGDAIRALLRIRDGEDGVELRDARVGDPPLHAVEHPPVTVAHRPGLHRHGVRAGVRLREAVGEHPGARRDRGEVLLLEVVGAGQDQRHGAELVDAGDQRRRGARAGDLLDHDAGRERVGTGAAVLLADVRCREVRGGQRIVRRLRELARLVDLGRVRRHLGVADRTDRLADGLVLLGQGVHRVLAHGRILLLSRAAGRGLRLSDAPRPGSRSTAHTRGQHVVERGRGEVPVGVRQQDDTGPALRKGVGNGHVPVHDPRVPDGGPAARRQQGQTEPVAGPGPHGTGHGPRHPVDERRADDLAGEQCAKNRSRSGRRTPCPRLTRTPSSDWPVARSMIMPSSA